MTTTATAQLSFRAMGSQIQIIADAPEAEAAALQLAPKWFEDWEQCLSRFRPDSELSRLNRRSGAAVAVSPVLGRVLQLALGAARTSGGLVLPTTLDALEAAGYDRDFAQLGAPSTSAPAARSPSPARPAAGGRAISFDPARLLVRVQPGVRIDLGGIAKGWAAGEAMRRLRGGGPVLVDAGGDIAISGPRAGGAPWPVGVADPRAPEALLDVLLVPGGGVATSGRDYRRWQHQGRPQHHIIDPRTGRPAATDILSATIIARDLVAAEVAAKTVLIHGSAAGFAWLIARPHLAGLIALEDGRVLRTPSLARYTRSNS